MNLEYSFTTVIFLGFPPTFGPTFVHMYGSTRDYSILDKHATLNTGLGEGVSYRARVLVAIRTEITENTEFMNSGVEVEPTYPITEVKNYMIIEIVNFVCFNKTKQ